MIPVEVGLPGAVWSLGTSVHIDCSCDSILMHCMLNPSLKAYILSSRAHQTWVLPSSSWQLSDLASIASTCCMCFMTMGMVFTASTPLFLYPEARNASILFVCGLPGMVPSSIGPLNVCWMNYWTMWDKPCKGIWPYRQSIVDWGVGASVLSKNIEWVLHSGRIEVPNSQGPGVRKRIRPSGRARN